MRPHTTGVRAAIKNGQSPPDALNLPVRTAPTPPSSPVPMILLIVLISGALIVLGAASLAFYQRYQQHTAALPDEDQTGPLPGLSLKTRVQQIRKIMHDLKQKIRSTQRRNTLPNCDKRVFDPPYTWSEVGTRI